ncbi:U32 family peptidase [Caldimonas thermodepolymerans]|uniref:Protease n=1 Tax=Caldimonas thermodepolymerans TaxID=215580 RepID=A0A2S5T6P7_9BURK|nr:U32 family peptidase [Caldimonas thermodepolymerans]PPE70602.1 collagenase-like protease [Caldimonas thermodepolymerans]QPC30015.1 U32 family peptidase [Caldimonas thermodepolymerans]RDH97639.1 putative protease [Caldimonas thermodepolymerans]TCP10052.1 putative protease [Caldimonas thermodepolymerans]UZG42760.1 U32 family peptidase [Caldimonas thermodepolymerans]
MARPELELLSPARNADIGIEAVNHGADAVYIGGPAFGARAAAGNELADIERLTRHAHRYGARIFVTLNTILRDDELEPARRLAWQVYEAGADALIIQDMGLLELDLPPIQLHASTQTDIRTVEKARFLQDVGFSQIVLARELSLPQIGQIAAATDCTLEFFIHGALCVAYSGQCYISHAHTGRSANRGDCSQACRLPYNVVDPQGRIVAHEKHVLSMKDNNQSANLRALVDAGIRSFKIEGRYKDMGYVKNITAHYRRLLDEILEERPGLQRASSGRCTFFFTPDPDRNFNRGATDYFVNGRQPDIGAFDSPKHAGLPLGWVDKVGPAWFDVDTDQELHNGDGLTYFDLQRELVGVQVNRAERLGPSRWRVHPNEPVASLKDLRAGTELHRNRDVAWDRLLERKSAERRIGVWVRLEDTADGCALHLTDEDGHEARATFAHAREPARDPVRAEAALREHLGRFGNTIFEPIEVRIACAQPWFLPPSVLNAARREAVEALEAARAAAWQRLPRAVPVEPPVPYPEDTLSYLANVYNHKARDFYARHGVKVIEAAYESHEELGEVSLMITKHCVRYSLSLCPKQAKGVTGVQGTVRAEPLMLVNGKEKLTLRFDCKPCEMHVVGRIKRSVLNQAAAVPVTFYRTRPATPAR